MNVFTSPRLYGYSAVIIGMFGLPAAYLHAGMTHNYSNEFDDYTHQDAYNVNLHDPSNDMIIWMGPVLLIVILLFLNAHRLKKRESND